MMKIEGGKDNTVRLVLIVLLLLLSVASVYGAGSPEQGNGQTAGGSQSASGANPDIDYLGVAGVMVRDGRYERAERALENVDPSDEGVDLARYYTLQGLLRLRRARFDEAVSAFEQAIENGQEDTVIYVYLAQAHYGAQDYEATVSAIDRVDTLTQFPDLIGIRSQALWELERTGEAFAAIERAIELYPSRQQFRRQRIFYLIELDLTQAAATASAEYLAQAEDSPEAYTTIGEAFRRGGQAERAIHTMEMAKLRFPDSQRVRLALAQAYLDSERPRIAARIIEEAAAYDAQYYHDAAELFRRAGDTDRALYLNSLVTDPEKKTRQRFNLLLSEERFEEALALEDRLERVGAQQDDAVLYALAYSHFQAQNFETAISYTNRISSSEYFRQATQLRQAIETVRNQPVRYF